MTCWNYYLRCVLYFRWPHQSFKYTFYVDLVKGKLIGNKIEQMVKYDKIEGENINVNPQQTRKTI